MGIIRKALDNQRGNYLVQTMTGSVINLLVLGAIAAGLVAVMFAQAGVAAKTSVSNQINQASSSLRSDVQWAGNIPAASATEKSVRIVVPGFGGSPGTPILDAGGSPVLDASGNPTYEPGTAIEAGCKTVEWTIAPKGDKTELKSLTRVYQNSTFKAAVPQTGTPGEPGYVPGQPITAGSATGVMACSGAIKSERDEVVVNDVGSDAMFTYLNVGGSTLVQDPASVDPNDASGAFREMKVATANSDLSIQSVSDVAKLEATRIAGVKLQGKVAATNAARSSDLQVLQMATNLDRKALPVSGASSTNLETSAFTLN